MRILLAIVITVMLCSPLAAQNVLLFTVDSLRADRLGVYEDSLETTPNLDAWAARGTVFENAFSTSAWTAPGLASVLSGLYPPTHGVRGRDDTGPRDLPTLIKILQQRNYRTPNLNFFTFASYYQNLGLGPIERKYFGKQSGDELLNWLDSNLGPGKEAPFFVWYHSTLVHQPYNPPTESLPAPRAELEKSEGIKAVLNGAIVPIGSAKFTDSDKPILDQLYAGEVRRVDELFQKALSLLEQKGELANTLVILTADHGEELLDHGFVGHASTSLQAKLYNEFLRIPLVMVWPGRVPAQRVKTPVSQIDILPTVLKLLQLPSPALQHGQDILGPIKKRPLFFESVIAGNQTTRENENLWVRAIFKEDLKYISTEELYDLERDPSEKKNLVVRRAQQADRMRLELETWLEQRLAEQAKFDFSLVRDARDAPCPTIITPENERKIDFDAHTGAILIDWTGSPESAYLVQYQIGEGDHHVAGIFEAQGNHQLLGPLNRELWSNLTAWNPFLIRVAPRTATPCWSEWVRFEF